MVFVMPKGPKMVTSWSERASLLRIILFWPFLTLLALPSIKLPLMLNMFVN